MVKLYAYGDKTEPTATGKRWEGNVIAVPKGQKLGVYYDVTYKERREITIKPTENPLQATSEKLGHGITISTTDVTQPSEIPLYQHIAHNRQYHHHNHGLFLLWPNLQPLRPRSTAKPWKSPAPTANANTKP